MTADPSREEIKLRETISPKQFAKALGVSESSVKRWCDHGALEAGRTPGGHRRISLRAAIEFARQSGRPIVSPDMLGMPKSNNVAELPELRPFLIRALLEGKEPPVRDMLLEVFVNHSSFVTVIDDLLHPAMRAIGDGCLDGSIKFYEERRACSLILGVLAELRSKLSSVADHPRACGGTLSNDFHGVGSRIVELVLRDRNWNAICLGTNCPEQAFVEAAIDFEPKLVWLSSSFHTDPATFESQCISLAGKLAEHNIPLIVGGPAASRIQATASNLEMVLSLKDFTTRVDRLKPDTAT